MVEMEFSEEKKKSSSLAPGFRFHPTDEELVRYYLRRKICRKPLRIDAISEIDIYKLEPWDLPSMSRLKTRDLEWYFFSVLDKKYGNGAKTNRATEKGYWKTTGKDRAVYHKTEIVGMKKTLVYHSGRAPKGQRTNWVMHEYKLSELELQRVGVIQDSFVLCRVFQKSGSGPKNGERYGAPFVEEDWENDKLEMVLKEEGAEQVDFGNDDGYLDGHDLEQILGSDVPSDTVPFPLNSHSADGSHDEETAEYANDSQNILVSVSEQHYEPPEQQDHENFYNVPALYDMDVRTVKHEFMGESSMSGNPEDLDYLLGEPFINSSDNLRYGDGGFPNDLPNPIETDASAFDMMEDYLKFFDSSDENAEYFAYDTAVIPQSDNLASDQALLPQTELNEGTEQVTLPNGQLVDNSNVNVAVSSDEQGSAKYQPDFQYSFIKHASQMLGGIPAPPAFAAEFPSKSAKCRISSEAQSSSSVRVTAGIIQIRSMDVGLKGSNLSSGKHETLNVILSFGLVRGDDGSTIFESGVSIFPGKTISTVSMGLLYFMFLWVLILSVSFKIGSYMCAH